MTTPDPGTSGGNGGGGGGSSVGIISGPGGGGDVNLGTGEWGFTPPSDFGIYNPLGPSVSWSLRYDSLRGADAAYQNDDFGQGWSQGYNVGVSQPLTNNVTATQGVAASLSATALVDTAATFSNHTWEIVQNGSVVATSLSPNGWTFTNVMSNPQVTPPSSAATGSLYELRQPYANNSTNNAFLFDVITPSAKVLPVTQFTTLQAASSTMASGQPAWTVLQNGSPVATPATPNGWQVQSSNGSSITFMPGTQTQPGAYQVQWVAGSNLVSATLTLVTPRAVALGGGKSLVLSNGARIAFTAPTVPLAGQTAIACTVAAGTPMQVEWDYDSSDPRGHFTITEADRSQWSTDAGTTYGALTYHSLKQMQDENGNVLHFVYGTSYGGSHLPLLSSITDTNNTALLMIARNASTGNITHVDDRYGRSVYYNVSTYTNANVPANYPQSQQELDHISQVVATGTASPPDRCVLGYQNVSNGEFSETIPMLHTVTMPSATGAGTQTATINYLASYGTVSSIVDANGNTHSYNQPDASHTQVTVTDASNNIVYRYTAGYDMNMSQTTETNGTVDGNGNNIQIVMSNSFADANDPYRPSQVQDGVGYAAGGLNGQGTTEKTWDKYGNCLTMTSARGTTTTLTYSYANFALGELTSVQEGTKTPTTFSYYEPSGLLHTLTAPKPGTAGQTTQTVTYSYTYSALGNVLTETGPGNNATTTKTTTFSYTSDPTYSYTQTEALHQPVVITDNLSHAKHLRYNSQARPTSVVDALGHETDLAYNITGQQISLTFPATGETGTGHAQMVNTFLYPDGPQTSTTQYNEAGTQVYQENMTYGKEGEQLTRTGSAQTMTEAYDGLYRLKTVMDGNLHATNYSYNQAGYLSQISYPNGDTLQVTSYDLNGNPLSRTDGRGTVTNFSYTDVASRLTNIAYPASASLNVAVSYDGYGRKSGITDGTGSQSVNYDDLGNATSVTTTYTGLAGQTISYGYNPDGSRSSLTLPDTTSYSNTYDGAGRHTGLTNPGGHSFSWSYANNDWLMSQTSDSTIVTTPSRDARGFITDLSHNRTDMTHTLLSEFALTYASNMTLGSVTSTVSGVTAFSGTTNYTHDTKLQLTQESSNRAGSYTNNNAFDSAGNLTTFKGVTQTFNNANQNNTTGAGYSYDGNGNPTSYKSNTLSFDVENRLTAYGTLLTAGYRADGQRAWKQNSSGVRTYFFYDGDKLLYETNSSGTVSAENTWSDTGLLARSTSTRTLLYTWDAQGNVCQQLNASTGSIVESYMFDAFGTRGTNGSDTAAMNDPYAGFGGSQGYYQDSETGLLLLGHRYYDATTGRFLTRDPISYAGGINLYECVGNSPLGGSDTDGLLKLPGSWVKDILTSCVLGGGLSVLVTLLQHGFGSCQVTAAACGVAASCLGSLFAFAILAIPGVGEADAASAGLITGCVGSILGNLAAYFLCAPLACPKNRSNLICALIAGAFGCAMNAIGGTSIAGGGLGDPLGPDVERKILMAIGLGDALGETSLCL